ncbi:MAG: GIY-YIG nuclease family protein [Isosphaeraceae bacterium]
MQIADYLVPGVYRITCEVNGMTYIGSASNILTRVAAHIALMSNSRHQIKKMSKDWARFGRQAFTYEILEIIERKSVRERAEKKAIAEFRDHTKLYNVVGNAFREERTLPWYKHIQKQRAAERRAARKADTGKIVSELPELVSGEDNGRMN